MGLSIHYSGKLRNKEVIPALTSEVTDICNSLKWPLQLLHVSQTNPLEGICFTPEGCETVFLTFFSDGTLCSPLNFMCKEAYAKHDLPPDIYLTASTKTQYAGADVHVALLKLFRFLKEKYFLVFELMDEGQYWETQDENVLKGRFDRYQMILDSVSDMLSTVKKEPDETAESLTDRIEDILKQKFGGADPDRVS